MAFHGTELVIYSHSREGKTLSYSRINTVSQLLWLLLYSVKELQIKRVNDKSGIVCIFLLEPYGTVACFSATFTKGRNVSLCLLSWMMSQWGLPYLLGNKTGFSHL